VSKRVIYDVVLIFGGQFCDIKFSHYLVLGTDAPTNHSFSQKTRLNDLSYGIKIWTDFSNVLSQFTRLTGRQTDRRTPFSRLDRPAFNAAQ